MLALINRFRQNPAGELALILNANDANVNNDLNFFHVDQNVLATQWASLSSAPPLAWNDLLASAALGHSQTMLAAQTQSHQVTGEPDPWTRIANAGYTNSTSLAENIFAFAKSTFEAEASFAIDWGNNPPTGIQSPTGHRDNLLSTSLREVGVGLVNAPNGSSMGPLLFTQDFGNRTTIGNPFVVGSIFADANNDGYYNPGEGLSGISITLTGTPGTFQTTGTAAGGYQIQVPAGTYQISASGGALAAPIIQTVIVGTDNVLVDFIEPKATIPAPPSFTSPPATTTDTTPTISWSAVNGATSYDLWVDNASTGQSQVIRNQTLTTNSFTPTTLLGAAGYKAYVRVTTPDGTSAWSAVYSFKIAPPAIPTLTAPTGSTSNLTPTFTWSASTDADHYDLWVNNVTTGQSQIVRQQALTSTTFTPPTNLPLGNYQAWIQAFNNAGNSAGWSTVLSFTITGQPAPTWSSPTGSTTNLTPTFAWSAVTGATRYDLWVTNNTTKQDQIIRQQNLNTNSYTPATALPLGSYTAWVQAYNVNVAITPWSTSLNFSIVAPSAPTITGPATTITTTTPTFTWTPSFGASQFDIWADNATTKQTQVVRVTVPGSPYTLANPIPRGQYTVWVRAGNSTGAFGSWSAPYSFLIDTTAPAIPTINAPASSASNLMPTIGWTNTGAARYDLWVDKAGGPAQVIRQQNLTSASFTPPANLTVGVYTAWVAAYDNTNQTRGWSAGYTFTITAPAAPTQLAPTGTIANTTPTFSWSAVADAVHYDLWVDNTTVGHAQSQYIRQLMLTTNSYTPTAALAKGSYRFWVRAMNANGNPGNWSVAADLTIA